MFTAVSSRKIHVIPVLTLRSHPPPPRSIHDYLLPQTGKCTDYENLYLHLSMKKQVWFFLFTALAVMTSAHRVDSAWVVTNYSKREVMIPMRDGVKLFTAIYSPKSQNEKHPILMVRTPYSVAPYGE